MILSQLNEALDRRAGLLTRNRILLESTDSTNRLALWLVRFCMDRGPLPPRMVVIALQQRSGRGRSGKAWVSVPEQGAYLSLVLGTSGPGDLASLPLLVSVGLARTVSEISGCPCSLKWPNDLMVSGRKIGGILIESVTRGAAPPAAVIGVGVNYGWSEAVSKVGGIAMSEVARQLPPLPEVISKLVCGIEDELGHIGDLTYAVARFRELSAHRPGDSLQFRVGECVQKGIFSGLDERGFLVLQSDRGEIRLSAGEAIEEWTGESHES